MTAEQIKTAVNEGKTVHYSTGAYKVERDTRAPEKYLIVCSRNGHTIGLTHRDGVTLNGNESDFFIAPEETHTITLTHNTERTKHTFNVKDPARLTRDEISQICEEMNTTAIFVNGKYYQG